MSLADDNICVICQIESVEASKNVKDIASVKGVDLLFVGPGDLSADIIICLFCSTKALNE